MDALPLISSPRPLIPGTRIGLRVPDAHLEPGDVIAVVARPYDDVARERRIGTVAVVEAVRPGAAGDAYLDASGRLLVEIERAGDEDRVIVSPVDERRPEVPEDLVASVERALRTYMAVRAESGDTGDIRISLSDDPVAASHEVASHLRISWPEVQELLEAGSAGDRLGRALLVLRRETGLLRSVLGGKEAT